MEDQIDLMNSYVRKQEEFTVEMIRRYLDLQSKYELLEKGAKRNVDVINDISESSVQNLKEVTDKYEVLKKDFDTLQNNYLLTQKELHRINIESGDRIRELEASLNKKNKKTANNKEAQSSNDEWN